MMRFLKFITLFSLSILLGACGGGGSSGTLTPTPAGDARAIITLEKSNLSTGEEVNVSARVADVAGNPVVGVKVTFSATAGMGTVTIVNDITDASGMAYAKLKATSNANGNTGQIKVTATVNGRAIENLANFYVNVPSNLKLTKVVSSKSVTVGGDVALTFYVENQDGTPYLDQVVDLNIASNYGYIAGTQQGKIRTVISGGKNFASVTYWASSSGIAYAYQDVITATLNYSYESETITINPLGATASVAYNSATKTVLGFGDAATLTFYVTDTSGTGRPSQTVTFSVTDITGTVDASADATVTASATTDAYGAAKVILNAKSGTTTKYVRVKATSGGVSILSPVITITQDPATGTVTLVASSTDVKIGSMLTATVTYTPTIAAVPVPAQNVTIKDAAGNTVASGITDASGKAYINIAPTVAGTLTLYAVIGTINSPAVLITVKGTDVTYGGLTIAASPATAKSGDIITATVTYTNSNATNLAGVPITVTSNNSAIIATRTGVTDATGKAIVNLPVTGTITADTVVTLYASSGTTLSPTTTVTISPATSTDSVLSLTVPAITGARSVAANAVAALGIFPVSASSTFKDSKGLPIKAASVVISVTSVAGWQAGDILTVNNVPFSNSSTPSETATVVTDSYGTALIPISLQATFPAAGATAGDVTARSLSIYWKATSQGYTVYGVSQVTISTTAL